ncbi:hypothetical protein [Dactylosporangium sp. CA-233914]|uniref:hypothetical protein n=1 Tax=Dactylosporangium sp. CA-233914 TaxID=3239934 RepID=UPI003D93F516
MKPLLVALMIGGAALGPTPPPGPPLPGPPAILEPLGPSATLAEPSEPGTIPPLVTPVEPSGRPPASSAAPSASAAVATPAPSAASASPSPLPVEVSSRRPMLWIGLGVVVVVAGAATWLIARRRRHAQS